MRDEAEGGVGERSSAARQDRKGRADATMLAVVAALVLFSPFRQGFADGFAGRPLVPVDWTPAGVVAAFVATAVAVWFAVVRWRRQDEVERHDTLVWLAVVGVVSVILRPLLQVAQTTFGIADPDAVTWYAALGAGLSVALARRFRSERGGV